MGQPHSIAIHITQPALLEKALINQFSLHSQLRQIAKTFIACTVWELQESYNQMWQVIILGTISPQGRGRMNTCCKRSPTGRRLVWTLKHLGTNKKIERPRVVLYNSHKRFLPSNQVTLSYRGYTRSGVSKPFN